MFPALILEDSKVLIHSSHLGFHGVAQRWLTESRAEAGGDGVWAQLGPESIGQGHLHLRMRDLK